MRHIASRLFNVPLLVNEAKLSAMMPFLGERLGFQAPDLDVSAELAEGAAVVPMPKQAGVRLQDLDEVTADMGPGGVAVTTTQRIRRVIIAGTLVDRYANAGSGAIGYDQITAAVEQAANDPNVAGILLDISSYGGEVAGCFEAAAAIRAAREKKPVWASINHDAYSAAYLLAVAGERVYVSQHGGCGSIGCMAMHFDWSENLAAEGIKPTVFRARTKKDMLSPLRPVEADVAQWVQSGVDAVCARFVAWVAEQRGVDAATVEATESRWLRPDEALSLGLVDAVNEFSVAVADFRQAIRENKQTGGAADRKERQMADTNVMTAEQLSAAKSEATSAERARWATVLQAEASAPHQAAVIHMLANTDMTPEQIAGVVAAMPVVKKGASSDFAQQMAQANPKVGPPGAASQAAADGEESEAAMVARIAKMGQQAR